MAVNATGMSNYDSNGGVWMNQITRDFLEPATANSFAPPPQANTGPDEASDWDIIKGNATAQVGLTAIQGALDVGLGIAAGMASEAGYKAEAQMHRYRAGQIAFDGNFRLREEKRRFEDVRGGQIAARAGQGVTMAGSSLDVLEDAAMDSAANSWFLEYGIMSAVDAEFYLARMSDFNASQARMQMIGAAIGGVGRAIGSAGVSLGQGLG